MRVIEVTEKTTAIHDVTHEEYGQFFTGEECVEITKFGGGIILMYDFDTMTLEYDEILNNVAPESYGSKYQILGKPVYVCKLGEIKGKTSNSIVDMDNDEIQMVLAALAD